MSLNQSEILEQLRKSREKKPPKEKKYLRKIGLKKQVQIDKERENGTDAALDRWFEYFRMGMTGICFFCGGKTEKDNNKLYRNSCAHLLPKRKNMFPSVRVHPDNRIELCFYGNSCHANFDNGTISLEHLKDDERIWGVIVEKFQKIYPYIAPEERKNIPAILMNELT